MPTAVQELMSSPPVTCPADASLAEATSLMDSRQIGSVVVTDQRRRRRHPHRARPAAGRGHACRSARPSRSGGG